MGKNDNKQTFPVICSTLQVVENMNCNTVRHGRQRFAPLRPSVFATTNLLVMYNALRASVGPAEVQMRILPGRELPQYKPIIPILIATGLAPIWWTRNIEQEARNAFAISLVGLESLLRIPRLQKFLQLLRVINNKLSRKSRDITPRAIGKAAMALANCLRAGAFVISAAPSRSHDVTGFCVRAVRLLLTLLAETQRISFTDRSRRWRAGTGAVHASPMRLPVST